MILKHKIYRGVQATLRRQGIYVPTRFLTPKRIDLAAKTMYARSVIEKNSSTWPEEVYKEHIRSFNGFRERQPKKQTYEEFRGAYQQVITSMQAGTFTHHKSPIVADENDTLTNGSHRVSAAIALGGRRVNVVRNRTLSKISFDYTFFGSEKGGAHSKLDEKYLDAMTIEYVSQKYQNIFAVVIFPSAHGHRKEVHEHLLSMGQIVNEKSIAKDELFGPSVIRQLYYGEKWNDTYKGTSFKAEACFKGEGALHVYILETTLDEEGRRKEKEYLRGLWKVDKHSIHITDTIEETNRVARMFFHEGSRRFLKLQQEPFFSEKIEASFKELVQALPKNAIKRDNICIEGTAVMDLLGMRAANDIDYITRATPFHFKSKTVDCHNAYNAKHHNKPHTLSNDEIISHPDNYFYFLGLKFIDINMLRAYKTRRGESKDKKDCTLIDDWLNKHKDFAKK